MPTNNPLSSYIHAFVDELVRAGVRRIVISPGSRSTPIAMAAAQHPKMETWVNVDERSAAFFALGMAKGSQHPVAILCTSGTAAANYMPAVVEAKQSRVPLIVLTADRPHELRDVGAPQVIDQLNMFGNYAKWFVDLAIPESTNEMLRYIRTVADRAVALTKSEPAGVVHLNFPLREPLIPGPMPNMMKTAARDGMNPYTRISMGVKHLSKEQIFDYCRLFENVEKGLIVCGPQDDPMLSEFILLLSKRLNWPIISDPLSQLRSIARDEDHVIETYDAFLRDQEISNSLVPELVLRFGAMPVSKAYTLFIKNNPQIKQFIVDLDNDWREPTLMASHMIYADSKYFCEKVADSIQNTSGNDEWLESWKKVNSVTRQTIEYYYTGDVLFEGNVIKELIELIPENSSLFVSNSMPIRDLDTFYLNQSKQVTTYANRGANGIDGIISSALGVSTVSERLFLVIGDLSFYHDLNGLLAAKVYQLNITIIVINNDGGGIFSFLPQAKHPEHFEELFGTPHGLDFEYVVKMYGGTFDRIKSWQQFKDAVLNSMNRKGLQVIEVPTERDDNVNLHRLLWKEVHQNVKEATRYEGS
ncbi:2-succinyl-5-enolpyruvyl-6-hydroxy-3-cyclohexene-1-carboxylic-acid synthase [Bacillus solimangrovi]|uniref:2-succinyl-5-enolpyruvyl-6-hydroxy-3-cyclohexene-1-carboxylate synthase n=1 Tax=Bacillus solimangrovi TaxID=1305675 RepID=A0A1E5LGE2_9BACI|nr:2-succinyl-5-enolpyruvyl-6-hydroxy-3-cyclohexene-1-carboxylic-acid synthase [Bacillus solimangrovi]OEH93143.1 2-succinyl-5-enolpyruvyl-6-hydroxy-3-cyclohexene-1-carboxylic-acid synthase [Bacillus solimangrovi]